MNNYTYIIAAPGTRLVYRPLAEVNSEKSVPVIGWQAYIGGWHPVILIEGMLEGVRAGDLLREGQFVRIVVPD